MSEKLLKLSEALKAVADEEELDGEMPQDMMNSIIGDANMITEALRSSVRVTKRRISNRLEALFADKKLENTEQLDVTIKARDWLILGDVPVGAVVQYKTAHHGAHESLAVGKVEGYTFLGLSEKWPNSMKVLRWKWPKDEIWSDR